MEKRTTKKIVSDSLHTYGKVLWAGGSGKQFTLPFEWNTEKDKSGFKFLFFAYGKKADVVRKLTDILNTMSDLEIEKLEFVKCNSKVPISLRSGTGLNCF